MFLEEDEFHDLFLYGCPLFTLLCLLRLDLDNSIREILDESEKGMLNRMEKCNT